MVFTLPWFEVHGLVANGGCGRELGYYHLLLLFIIYYLSTTSYVEYYILSKAKVHTYVL